MPGPFSALDIAATGARLGSEWLDTLAHNLANVNTVRPPDEEPFRARLVQATAVDGPDDAPGRGVAIQGFPETAGEPPLAYAPDHPYADEEGYIRLPVVDMAGQMTDLIIASRAYQASLSAMRSAREAYESALEIGR